MNSDGLFAGVNWFAVMASTVAAFALGGLWYSRALFGLKWMQEVGLTEEAVNNAKMGPIFGGTFLLQLLAATALAVFLGPDSNWHIGLHTGLIIGLCWVATAYGTTYLFEQRSIRLFLINAGYYVVSFSVVGVILGAWH